MSDPLKDAMSRAVDRIAPFPPDAEALKAAAKRSRYRRHIAGGLMGFIILSTLSGWLLSDNDAFEDRDPPNRNQIAAPTSWDNPSIAASIDLPAEPRSITTDGDDVWVGLLNGDLVRIDPATNEVVQTIDVGGAIIEIAADDGTVWAAGTPEGVEVSNPFGGYHIEHIFKVDTASGSVTDTIELRAPSNVRMAAGGGRLVYLDNTNSSSAGRVFRYDAGSGEVTNLEMSASSLALSNDALWLGGGYEVRRVDPDTGELMESVDASDGSRTFEVCADCPPPLRSTVAGGGYVAHISEMSLLNVLDDSGKLLYQKEMDIPEFGESLAVDGETLFVVLRGRKLGLFDVATGEREHVIEGLGRYAGQMTVASESVWIVDSDKHRVVRISDLVPESVPAPVESGSPDPEEDQQDLETYRDEANDFSLQYPSDWHVATGVTDDLVNPRELLVLSTVPIERGGQCAPEHVLEDLGADDVVMMLMERDRGSPLKIRGRRPDIRDFEGQMEFCWAQPTDGWDFGSSGRHLIIRKAPSELVPVFRKDQIQAIVNSLEFE